MTRSLLILAVLLLTAPAWLTGCGGGDGQPSVSSLAAQLLEQLPVIEHLREARDGGKLSLHGNRQEILDHPHLHGQLRRGDLRREGRGRRPLADVRAEDGLADRAGGTHEGRNVLSGQRRAKQEHPRRGIPPGARVVQPGGRIEKLPLDLAPPLPEDPYDPAGAGR